MIVELRKVKVRPMKGTACHAVFFIHFHPFSFHFMHFLRCSLLHPACSMFTLPLAHHPNYCVSLTHGLLAVLSRYFCLSY